MRGSALALAAAVVAAGVYVVNDPKTGIVDEENLVPEAYLYEAQRQVDVFLTWLRDEDATPSTDPGA